MPKHKTKHRESPHEVIRQILAKLKTESDPMQRELLKQRLHHYNTLVKPRPHK